MKQTITFVIIVVLMGSVLYLYKSNITCVKTVAPYTFLDIGKWGNDDDYVDITGTWTISDKKDYLEVSNIRCYKNYGLCIDATAQIFNKHLRAVPILWAIEHWSETEIIAKCLNPELYKESRLFIDRKNKTVFIAKSTDELGDNPREVMHNSDKLEYLASWYELDYIK